ncbi:MAG: class I SAM-dependent methyltransferase [Bacteroidetes bacterium]|nr:class I SAM-dependent methyltransferase [Bacteroidota bacterium]
MKYLPIINKIDNLVGNSASGHILLFKAMEYILPRTWHIKRAVYNWKANHPGHQHILDAGSGLGQYAYLLSDINPNWSIIGADLNETQVAHCNVVFRKLKKHNVLFKKSDLLKLENKPTYNLILATDLAEYVEDDTELFKRLRCSLKEDGQLLLYSHLVDRNNPDKRRVRMKLVDEQFRNGYSAKSLKKKLKEAGYHKIKVRFVFGLVGRISWYLSVFYPLKMLNAWFGTIFILPIYYFFTLPVTFLLNYLDTHTGHISGSAMLVSAHKCDNAE